jgi:2-polyprenyl-6-hydroxyphenyl methylase/3-demethylubiquinone-9 3-methyltransferase
MLARTLIEHNRRISKRIDDAVRPLGRRDGNYAFVSETLPGLLRSGQRVLDVGGGKNPGISPELKARFSLQIDGLDASDEELRKAPAGAYDATVVCDVSQARLAQQYDLIFSCAVMEHVRGVQAAIAALADALAPGGTMAHFVPNAFAPFAIANKVLGVDRARQLLFSAFPAARHLQGFAAYYEDCWPSRFRRLCEDNGLEVVSLAPHFCSGYVHFFWPAHTLDVARQLLLMGAHATDLCEAFTIVARKPG